MRSPEGANGHDEENPLSLSEGVEVSFEKAETLDELAEALGIQETEETLSWRRTLSVSMIVGIPDDTIITPSDLRLPSAAIYENYWEFLRNEADKNRSLGRIGLSVALASLWHKGGRMHMAREHLRQAYDDAYQQGLDGVAEVIDKIGMALFSPEKP